MLCPCLRRCWLMGVIALMLVPVGCQKSEEPTEVTSVETAPEVKVEEKTAEEAGEESEAVTAARGLGTPSDEPVVTTDTGLQYIDVRVGEGDAAEAGSTAVVHYTGWLVNGKKFDSSLDRNQTFDFPVGGGRVIKGWDQGVAGMKVGGVRKLIVPPDLGYGSRGIGPIPPDATLVFEVELVGVK